MGSVRSSTEAALVILVPQVEPLVSVFRLQYDPSAAAGMPAHITINYPFLPGADPDEPLNRKLTQLFSTFNAFRFMFRKFAKFPDVLYMAPEPVTPFRQLIEMVAARFPESPPYGGAFDNIVPHLTIAQSEDQQILDSIERQLGELSEGYLPHSVQAEQVWLMDNRTGVWQKRRSFSLGRK